MKKLVILSASLVAIAACSDSPTRAPTAQELAGAYVLSGPSASYLTQKKGYSALPRVEIDVATENSVKVRNMPDAYVDGFGRGSGRFLSGAGHWNVEALDRNGYGLTLLIEGDGTMAPGVYHGSSIAIRGRRAPYRLEVQLGDPDNNESITFERAS